MKKLFFNKYIIFYVLPIAAIVLSFYAGERLGRARAEIAPNVQNKDLAAVVTPVDFEPFWKAWQVLNEKYVGAASTTDQDKVWGAIKGLAASTGDPYTVFFPPEETKIFESDIKGTFEGVGMEIDVRDNILTVVTPLKNSPAEKAGVRAGDKIVKINDEPTTNMSTDQAVKLIRGPKGTTVKITVIHQSSRETEDITITRSTIDMPTIETEVKEDTLKSSPQTGSSTAEKPEKPKTTGLRSDGVFVIRLFSFSANSPRLFKEALREFANSGSDKLVLDLRGNPGGYLEAAWDIASWFLPAGKVVVSEDAGPDKPGKVYKSKGYDAFKNLKMVVLVNGGSASASEIVAGALQEHGVAKVVGTKTFGKGSVQELVKITPETSLKVTIAKWLTPEGNSITDKGITPDYVVRMDEDDIEEKKDPQLDKAVQVVKGL